MDGGATAFYVYNAAGFRVEQGVNSTDSVEYAYDLSGDEMASLVPGTTNLYQTELFDNGRHWVTFNGPAQFLHTDWLGTVRAVTNLSGSTTQQCTGLPFGDDLSCTSSLSEYMGISGSFFDSNDNQDHFLYRQYNPTEGRWVTPDPAGLAAVDPTNPQTWNRYAYVVSNPLSFIDPLGLYLRGGCDLADPCANGGGGGGGVSDPGGGMGGFCDASGDCSGISVCSDDDSCSNVGGIEAPITLPGAVTFGLAPLLQEEARYLTIISTGYDPATGDDPCVFSQYNNNGNYTGQSNVNTTYTQQQCVQHGGQWIAPGVPFTINPATGIVQPVQLPGGPNATCQWSGAGTVVLVAWAGGWGLRAGYLSLAGQEELAAPAGFVAALFTLGGAASGAVAWASCG